MRGATKVMCPDRLTRQAMRLAQRKSQKAGRPLTPEEIVRLQVQTVEPWKRIVIAVLGLLVGLFALVCYRGGAPWWIWGPFGLGSIIVILCGAFGRKAYIDRELRKMSDDLPRKILDAISNAL
jgi:hypothetical protein